MKYYLFLLGILCATGPVLFGQTCSTVSTLPTFCITTEDGAAITSKENYLNGSLSVVENTGTPVNLYSGGIRIRGRGNSTWLMSKKPYRINLNTASGILGMPASARNWVLLANYGDKTLVRNALALEVSRYLGMPYASPFRFVDVIINGEYQGAYLLTDHMEVRQQRVDIEEGQSESVQGAFLVEMDGFAWQEEPYLRTSNGLIASVKYPDISAATDPRFSYINNYLNEFEARLFSNVHAEGSGGYLERMDKQSLINWYIGCEITGNSDAFWSVYLHKRRSDERMFLGPHWDFDIAFDNDDRINLARYRLMADVGHDHIFRRWIVRLRQDDVFMSALKQRWNELRNGGFKEHVLSKINEYTGVLTNSGSQQNNYLKWPVLDTRVYREVLHQGSYQEHVNFLYNYVRDRFDWLDQELNGLPSSFNYQIVNVATHKALSVGESGNSVVQRTYEEASGFLWQIRPLANGYYQVYNAGRDKVLATTEPVLHGRQVELATLNPGDRKQQWRISQTSENQFAIISRDGRFGLQLSGSSSPEGAPVQVGEILAYDPEPQAGQHVWLNNVVEGKWSINAVGSPLPVRISEFSGRLSEENEVHLNWYVTEQVNGSHFEVQRRGKEGQFDRIGTVLLAGTGTGRYSWTDRSPLPGNNYYRLRTVDLDGTAAFTHIVSVASDREITSAHVFPNPASGASRIRLEVRQKGNIEIEVYNSMGIRVLRVVEAVENGVNDIPLNPDGLVPGLYVVKINHESRTETAKFILK